MNALPLPVATDIKDAPDELEYDLYDENGALLQAGLKTSTFVDPENFATRHHLEGLMGAGLVNPTAVIRDGKRYAVRCNGDEIAVGQEVQSMDDRPRQGAPKP